MAGAAYGDVRYGQQSDRRTLILLAFSATAGVMVEFYDFFLYGYAAASAFPAVFFPNLPPTQALVFSYLAFGAGFPARLLGACIFGHFGDRAGRKVAFLGVVVPVRARNTRQAHSAVSRLAILYHVLWYRITPRTRPDPDLRKFSYEVPLLRNRNFIQSFGDLRRDDCSFAAGRIDRQRRGAQLVLRADCVRH